MPHDHRHVLAVWHKAGRQGGRAGHRRGARGPPDVVAHAVGATARPIFLKAADLLAGPYRMVLNAATMLGQSKTAHQAEIDAACELIDFWRFNVAYAEEIYRQQPRSSPGCWNYVEYRPLEGFVFAVTPFNFTSIAGNLPTAPGAHGQHRGLEAGVVGHLLRALHHGGARGGRPAARGHQHGARAWAPTWATRCSPPRTSPASTSPARRRPSRGCGRRSGRNIRRYRAYPRIVGETGGKDFVFAHPSADVPALATALDRGAFEYQGQKCSAASRAYIPASLWPALKEALLRADRGDPDGRRRRLHATSWAR